MLITISMIKANYVEETVKKEFKLRLFGEFHLGERYDINDWMTMSTCCIFFADIPRYDERQ